MRELREGGRRSHVSSAPNVLRALLRCYTPRLCKLRLEGDYKWSTTLVRLIRTGRCANVETE
jgi:hypothetical protein